MALVKADFTPGVDKQTSTYGAEGRWVDSKNVRFRTGLPEKIGGWEKVVSETIVGVVRGMKAWVSNSGVRYVALGTDRKLYLYSEGVFFDITPIRKTNNLTNPFTTINSSTVITVTDSASSVSIGDFVTFSGASTFNGVDMNKEFEVLTISGNDYTVAYPTNATGSGSGGGSVAAAYQITSGTPVSSFGFGFGVGPWNNGTWNTPRATSTIALEATNWTLDTFGEDLLAVRNDGALYIWDLSTGTSNRAKAVNTTNGFSANAPSSSRFVLVSSPDRHIFLFGTETTIGTPSTKDDLFLRFSSQEDYTDWAPTQENSAGTFRIQDGSKIVAAVRSRGSILVWTDTALHALNNIGPPFIFGLQQVGANCGAIAPDSVVDVNGVTYWMSQTAFYAFDGAIQKLPCTVQDYVFDDIDSTSQGQIAAAVNTDFNEVTWFYPTNGSNVLNRSVTYNYIENIWYTNTGFTRTGWVDRGVYSNPYATEYVPTSISNNTPTIYGLTAGATILYAQEVRGNSNADGVAMDCQITSGDFDIEEGNQVFLTSRVIPDFKVIEGTVAAGNSTEVAITFANYPASSNTRTFSANIDSNTKFFSVRGRGRQANIKISSNAIDNDWRFGTMRLDLKPDGRR